MKLHKAAIYFDRDPIHDGYTGECLFKAQFSSYEGAQPDGSFLRRRIMSMAPHLQVPARKVIKVYGDRWVIGTPIEDGWNGTPIRKTSPTKYVTDKFYILTPGQAALRQTVELFMYGYSLYKKDTVNTPTDGDYDAQYEVALGERVADGMFLKSADRFLRIRSPYAEPTGFEHYMADEISYAHGGNILNGELFNRNCEVDVVLSGGYDPVQDTETPGLVTTGILLDMYKMYRYNTQADPMNKPGDMTLVLSQTVGAIETGRHITVNSTPWRVMSVTPWQDAWNLHLRRD